MKRKIYLHELNNSRIMFIFLTSIGYVLTFFIMAILGKRFNFVNVLSKSPQSYVIYPVQFYFAMIQYIFMSVLIQNIFIQKFESNIIRYEMTLPTSRMCYFFKKILFSLIGILLLNVLFYMLIAVSLSMLFPKELINETLYILKKNIIYSFYNQVPLFIIGCIISCVFRKKIFVYFYFIVLIITGILFSGLLNNLLPVWGAIPNLMILALALGQLLNMQMTNMSVVFSTIYSMVTIVLFYVVIKKMEY